MANIKFTSKEVSGTIITEKIDYSKIPKFLIIAKYPTYYTVAHGGIKKQFKNKNEVIKYLIKVIR